MSNERGSSIIILFAVISLLLVSYFLGFLTHQKFFSLKTREESTSEVAEHGSKSQGLAPQDSSLDSQGVMYGSITAYRGDFEGYTFRLEATSPTNDEIEMKYGGDGGLTSSGWVPFEEFVKIPRDDFNKFVFVQFRDAAGNVTPTYVDSDSPIYPTGKLAL